MENDAAKSYIETVMARADGASKGTDGGWLTRWGGGPRPALPGSAGKQHMEIRCDGDDYGCDVISSERNGQSAYVYMKEADAVFIGCSRQDIPTLAKIALRAIAALEEYDDASEFPSNRAAKALADINALAAKGSQ